MKKLIAAAALALTSSATFATTLNFDTVSGNLAGSGYGGFNWNNFYVLNGTWGSGGYHNGVISADNVAYNAWANPASFSSNTAFTLNDAFFTGAWNDGLNIHVVGTGANSYVKDFTVSTLSPSHIVFNWTGLTNVTFSSFGGSSHGYGGAGAHFALDNLTVNADVNAPEPSSLLLMGLGLLGLGFARKRASK